MQKDINYFSKVVDTVSRAYIEAVYFTDTGDNEQPASDIEMAPVSAIRALSDCADFIRQCEHAGLVDGYLAAGFTWDSFGHDFWLTRNRHGAGFWDRGLPGDLGKKLTDLAQMAGSVDTYEGDDGMFYFF